MNESCLGTKSWFGSKLEYLLLHKMPEKICIMLIELETRSQGTKNAWQWEEKGNKREEQQRDHQGQRTGRASMALHIHAAYGGPTMEIFFAWRSTVCAKPSTEETKLW